jgi:PAS domain S-box-containing protein
VTQQQLGAIFDMIHQVMYLVSLWLMCRVSGASLRRRERWGWMLLAIGIISFRMAVRYGPWETQLPGVFDDVIVALLLGIWISLLVIVLRETSTRKRIVDESARTRAIYRAIGRVAFEGGIITDARGVVRFALPRGSGVMGHGTEDAVGLNLFDQICPDHADAARQAWEKILANPGVSITTTLPGKHRDGRTVWVLATSINLLSDPEVAGVAISLQDISQQRKQDDELRAIELRHKFITEHVMDMISQHSPAGEYVYVSPAGERLLGYTNDELIGRNAYELFHPADQDAVREVHEKLLACEPVTSVQYRLLRKDGSYVWVETESTIIRTASGTPSSIICTTRDISDRIRQSAEQDRLREQLFATQKLESLGLLAGGIAHDFNNLLQLILGNLALAQPHFESSEVRGLLQQALSATERAASLTDQLLAYSGRSALAVKPLDVTRLIRGITDLLQSGVGRRAELKLDLEEGMSPVIADATQLQQVVMNLVINASEAVSEAGGRVEVRCGSLRLTEPEDVVRGSDGRLPSGEYVVIDVSDNGRGMSEETASRMFDPFFSTKGTGRGLGLAAVLGIVRRHNGGLQVRTAPGKGTSIRVLLPSTSGEVRTETPVAEVPPRMGRGRVLAVDDEPLIRMLVSRILTEAGYTVTVAESGMRALDLMLEAAGRFDIIILDSTMPGINGLETLTAIRRDYGKIPVLMCSGFAESDVIDDIASLENVEFLHKPFHPKSLIAAVHRIIAAAEAAAENKPSRTATLSPG